MTNSEEEVAAEDEPMLADQPVLGVLTGQVPVSGPMGKGQPGTFADRIGADVRRKADEAGADISEYAEYEEGESQ